MWLPISLINQTRNVKIDGIELVLRDPVFDKVLTVANCVEQWNGSLFPLKMGMAHVRYPLSLPFLAPVVQRSRYTLTLTPYGRSLSKKDSLQLSIPLAVVESQRLYEFNVHQVFATPFDTIAQREGATLPRVIADVVRYYREHPPTRVWHTHTDGELMSWLRAQYDAGEPHVFEKNADSVDQFVAGTLLLQFLWSLPEPVVPLTFWPTFRDASRAEEVTQRLDSVRRLVALLPPGRRAILVVLVHLLLDLVQLKALPNAADVFAAAIARPPGRTPDAMAVAENLESTAIAQALLLAFQ